MATIVEIHPVIENSFGFSRGINVWRDGVITLTVFLTSRTKQDLLDQMDVWQEVILKYTRTRVFDRFEVGEKATYFLKRRKLLVQRDTFPFDKFK